MTDGNQRVPTLSGRLLFFLGRHLFLFLAMPQDNAIKHLFCRLGKQAPAGEGGPSQQVWEFPGALVNIFRAAIIQ